MMLVKAIHSIEFLKKHNLGVEFCVLRDESELHAPFIGGIHLPYAGINLGALDPAERKRGMDFLLQAFEKALTYPVTRMVAHPMGFDTSNNVRVGDYEIWIENFRIFAEIAAKAGITICIENQLMQKPEYNQIYGTIADDWFQLLHDLDCDNLMLTLDTSHAASSAARFIDDPERQLEEMYAFLRHPELIGRVHWSDACLANNASLFRDCHLPPGKGDLPRDFHRKVKELDAVKLLEQKCSEDDVLKALEFIDGL